jgi:PTS system mannose-specific IIA component/fructoselysine and glucoselysine-specific PTS system IIA component
MLRYIIASHGILSEGFLDALGLLIGELGNVEAITAFVNEESLEKRVEAILSRYDDCDTIVIFTDLLGGSVNQHFAKMMSGSGKLHLIAGCNLVLLLEVILGMPDEFDESFVRSAIEKSRKEMVYMNDFMLAVDNPRHSGEIDE